MSLRNAALVFAVIGSFGIGIAQAETYSSPTALPAGAAHHPWPHHQRGWMRHWAARAPVPPLLMVVEHHRHRLHLTLGQQSTLQATQKAAWSQFRSLRRSAWQDGIALHKAIMAGEDEPALIPLLHKLDEDRSAMTRAMLDLDLKVRKILTPQQEVLLRRLSNHPDPFHGTPSKHGVQASSSHT
ncbi:Spy/CpxP family protein refolding chaperone [Acidithiobacillus sulfuriphilus]|uniref:Spy/CpxP family protein refolding chaperone n=1 Tax=Acidithiobacillus sulfuriphilus TaxID=1867749 RepID=UPI003F5E2F59